MIDIDAAIEHISNGENFSLPRRELMLAMDYSGRHLMTPAQHSDGGLYFTLMGCPVVMVDDRAVVFCRCEYCGGSAGVNARSCCLQCGAPVR